CAARHREARRDPAKRPMHRAAVKRWRERHPEQVKAKDARVPKNKYLAHLKVSGALLTKRLVRPGRCERCDEKCVPHAHHDDYSKPLAVRWLCPPCHMAIHTYAKEK